MQCEAISYGPSMDLQSVGLCTFMSMQIPRLTEFSGGGKRNVANPVPIDPGHQSQTLKGGGSVHYLA